ncbi:MAG TPA: hypothetical protein VK139_00325 [Microbacteriaceae bacterium]|nr:hypothetical protein [Microbacteriaceae bacterium]
MNVVWFVVSFGLFMIGLWLFGAAFSDPNTAIWVFTAGILLVSVSMYIPFHVLGISKKHDH